MTAMELRDSLRTVRDNLEQNHAIRLHRAVSWLHCAEAYIDLDEDVALITLWIAFNSCYAIDDERNEHDERQDFNEFASKLCAIDSDNKIYNLLWSKYSQFVRLLIENQYVFAPFWSSVKSGDSSWESRFAHSKNRAFKALANNETAVLLGIVLDRLYVLRNQLLHGGATYKSKVNRAQVKDGKNLLLEIVPLCVELMMAHEEVDWGNIHFPVIENA